MSMVRGVVLSFVSLMQPPLFLLHIPMSDFPFLHLRRLSIEGLMGFVSECWMAFFFLLFLFD